MEINLVKVHKEDRAAYVTLNRPDKLNALSPELLDALRGVFSRLHDDQEIKAVVVTGAGRAFCAGADLARVEGFLRDIGVFVDYMQKLNDTMSAVAEFPLPVIARVNGLAFAGGLELLLACDMAITTEDTQIGDQHQNFGIIGGPIHWQLPRHIGLQKAAEMCLTGKWLSGKEAESYGIVLRAVSADALDSEIEKLLDQLRDKARPALIANKKALKRCLTVPDFRDGVRMSAAFCIDYMSAAEEPRIGIKAFLEKRKPEFM